MPKQNFQDFLIDLALREAEKMNTCHSPSTGQFCSGGGGGSGGGASEDPYAGITFSSRNPTEIKEGDKVVAYVNPSDPDFNLPSKSSNIRADNGKLVKIGTTGVVSKKYDADPYQDAEVHIKWNDGSTSKYSWGEYDRGRKYDSVEMTRLNNSLKEKFRIIE